MTASDLDARLAAYPVNTLFARAVVQGQVRGDILSGDSPQHTPCAIRHPYGMTLLLQPQSPRQVRSVLQQLASRSRERRLPEWILPALGLPLDNPVTAASPEWTDVGRINTRFRADRFRPEAGTPPPGVTLRPTSGGDFLAMRGRVVPASFWDNPSVFLAGGTGVSLFVDNTLAALAFSAFCIGNRIEIGIETLPEYRGTGLATLACTALINHCLTTGLEPVWSCSATNTGSRALARRLGFEETMTLPYLQYTSPP